MTVTTLGRSTSQTIGMVLSDAFRDEPLARWIVPAPLARPVLIARLFALTAAQALTDGTVDIITDGTVDITTDGTDRPHDRDLGTCAGPDNSSRGGVSAQPWVVTEPGSELDAAELDTRELDGVAVDGVGFGRMVGAALWFDYSLPSDNPHVSDSLMDACVVEVLGAEAAGRWRTAMDVMAARHPPRSHQYLALIGVTDDRQRHGLGARLLAHRLRHLDRILSGAYLEATTPASRSFYARWGFHDLGRPIDIPGDGPTVWPMYRDPYPHGHPRP